MEIKFLIFAQTIMLTCFFMISCSSESIDSSDEDLQPEILTNDEIREWQEKLQGIEAVRVEDGEIAVLETSLGTITFRFFTDVAPNHCANFKKLANSGFYDWTTFHRVIPGFMLQGGDINSKNDNPSDDGTGSPGYTVNAEFSDMTHKRGIISTARKGNDINSAGSQFFIIHEDSPHLDGQYTVFGEVIEGIEVVDAIASVSRDRGDRPVESVYIKKARVEKQ